MKISIKTIPHARQRYPTSGDWQQTIAGLEISVSRMSSTHYEFLLGLHEVVEAMLCQHCGVRQATVDRFDEVYEANRPQDDKDSEPGDVPAAPYHRQHVIASVVERLAAELLGVNWSEYAAELARLSPTPVHPCEGEGRGKE